VNSNKISRRQALKALLAASGGLTAAAFVPSKWVKPLVMSGVLPVHAQTSVLNLTFNNPAEVGDSSNTRNGHQVATLFRYIYYNFNSGSFLNSTIDAAVGGTNVNGIDVEMDIANVVGTAQFGYMVSGVPTYTFPIIKTTDATGVAHFPVLMPNHTTAGSSFDLRFTYKRGGTTLSVSNVHFTISVTI
jgi:hypothetical protein